LQNLHPGPADEIKQLFHDASFESRLLDQEDIY
jgi:hypothetical protein